MEELVVRTKDIQLTLKFVECFPLGMSMTKVICGLNENRKPHCHLPGSLLEFLPIEVSALHSARSPAKLGLSSIEICMLFSNGF